MTPDSVADKSSLEADFMRRLDRRIRRTRVAALARNAGVQAAWSLTLLAGAGVPLVSSFDWNATASVLGFVVVVASGAERIFARTADGGEAIERLHRGLASERRLYQACAGPYGDDATRFEQLVERTESLISIYDAAIVETNRRQTQPTT